MDLHRQICARTMRRAFALLAALTILAATGLALDLLAHKPRDGSFTYQAIDVPQGGPQSSDDSFILWTHVAGAPHELLWGDWSAPWGVDRVLIVPESDIDHLLAGEEPTRVFHERTGNTEVEGHVRLQVPGQAACPECAIEHVALRPGERATEVPMLAVVWMRGDAWVGTDRSQSEVGMWHFSADDQVTSHGPVQFRSRFSDAGLAARLPAWQAAIAASAGGTLLAGVAWAVTERRPRSANPREGEGMQVAGTPSGTEEMLRLVQEAEQYVRLVSRHWLLAGVAITGGLALGMLALLPPTYAALRATFPAAEGVVPSFLVTLAGPLAAVAALTLWGERYRRVRAEAARWRSLTAQFNEEAEALLAD